MANTIFFEVKGDDQHYTVSELNTLFTNIKTLIDNKVDLRGDTLEADVFFQGSIINVPPAENSGDILQEGQRP